MLLRAWFEHSRFNFASSQWHGPQQVVLTSVRSDCRALEYAAAELKALQPLQQSAVSVSVQFYYAVSCATCEAGSDREIMMEAVAQLGFRNILSFCESG